MGHKLEKGQQQVLIAQAIMQNYDGTAKERNVMYVAIVAAIMAFICGIVATVATHVIWTISQVVFAIIALAMIMTAAKGSGCRGLHITLMVSMLLYGVLSSWFYMAIMNGGQGSSVIVIILTIIGWVPVIVATVFGVKAWKKKESQLYRRSSIVSIAMLPIIIIGTLIISLAVTICFNLLEVSHAFWLPFGSEHKLFFQVIVLSLIAEAVAHITGSTIKERYQNYSAYDQKQGIAKISSRTNKIMPVIQIFYVVVAIMVISAVTMSRI